MAARTGKKRPAKAKPARASRMTKARKRAALGSAKRPLVPAPKKTSRRPARHTSKPAQDIERDRVDILEVSKKWWDANRKFSIPLMREAFVGGDKFHGFNLNGHTYYAIDEWVQLWKYLADVMQPNADPSAAAMAEPRDVRLIIRGDMAFLTAESVFTVNVLPTSTSSSSLLPPPGQVARIPFRATEVFVREDHEGNPAWRMWHFHCSPKAPEGERRMGF